MALGDGGIDGIRVPYSNGGNISNGISNGNGKNDAADGESAGTRVTGESVVLEVIACVLFHRSFRTCCTRVNIFRGDFNNAHFLRQLRN